MGITGKWVKKGVQKGVILDPLFDPFCHYGQYKVNTVGPGRGNMTLPAIPAKGGQKGGQNDPKMTPF